MKAAVLSGYGPPEVVAVADVPTPGPRAGEVLVRVSAAGVTTGDTRMRSGEVPAGFGLILKAMLGFRRPRRPIFGREFAGTVAGLGPGAAGFTLGDAVFGITEGLRFGAHAELLTVRASGLILPRPDALTELEAAGFFFGGLTAADFLIDRAGLGAGERLLVNGATGSVGSAAVQIARSMGAEVTAVCSAASAEDARELGADAVLDYATGPLAGSWNVILDVIGTLPYPAARPLLAPGGRLMLVTATLAQQVDATLRPRRGTHRVAAGLVRETRPAMQRLIGLCRAGAYRPQIGAVFPLAAIAEAHAVAGSRHKRGNVVVTMGASNDPRT